MTVSPLVVYTREAGFVYCYQKINRWWYAIIKDETGAINTQGCFTTKKNAIEALNNWMKA